MVSRSAYDVAEAIRRRRVAGAAPLAAAKPVSPLAKIALGYEKAGKTPPQRPPSPAERVAEEEMRRWSGLNSKYRPARGDDGCS